MICRPCICLVVLFSFVFCLSSQGQERILDVEALLEPKTLEEWESLVKREGFETKFLARTNDHWVIVLKTVEGDVVHGLRPINENHPVYSTKICDEKGASVLAETDCCLHLPTRFRVNGELSEFDMGLALTLVRLKDPELKYVRVKITAITENSADKLLILNTLLEW